MIGYRLWVVGFRDAEKRKEKLEKSQQRGRKKKMSSRTVITNTPARVRDLFVA